MYLLQNKKARFHYDFLEEFEAGVSLLGWEVKTLRARRGNLVGAWVSFKNGEAFLEAMKLVAWEFGQGNQDLIRPRKLLLHKKEILRLEQKSRESGWSVIPLAVVLKNGKIKVQLALGKGRKLYEKKQYLKEREIDRETARMG